MEQRPGPGGQTEAKILTSAAANLELVEKVLDQVDMLLGEPRDTKGEEVAQPTRNPLATIQTDLDRAKKSLLVISEKLMVIKSRIW